jgi:hypothetical protein
VVSDHSDETFTHEWDGSESLFQTVNPLPSEFIDIFVDWNVNGHAEAHFTEFGCQVSTTSTLPPTTTTLPPTTTTTPPTTTTTLPGTFAFAGATTVCRAEVPTIVIDFATPGFPSLAGHVGTLTMSDVNGNVVSTQPLTYQPGAHVELLYPGTAVNPDGSIADVPGWILQPNGLWVLDPSDAFLREGILLTFTVNPTAEALVTYPPESSACANPEATQVSFADPAAVAETDESLARTGNSGWLPVLGIALLLTGFVLWARYRPSHQS